MYNVVIQYLWTDHLDRPSYHLSLYKVYKVVAYIPYADYYSAFYTVTSMNWNM